MGMGLDVGAIVGYLGPIPSIDSAESEVLSMSVKVVAQKWE